MCMRLCRFPLIYFALICEKPIGCLSFGNFECCIWYVEYGHGEIYWVATDIFNLQ